MNVALRPSALQPGDTIGIAAPASAFKAELFERAVAWLEVCGFQVKLAPGIFERHHYLAGKASTRVDDLHMLFADPDVKAIFCARGGYGSMQLLPHLDYDLSAANPKIFVGYSDLTPLLGAIRDRCGLVSYHGPVMTGLAGLTDDDSKAHLLAALSGWQMPPAALSARQSLVGGVAVAEAIGGNLTMMAAALGTPYQLETRGRILLVEEVGERPFRVDRVLTQLRLAGVFDEVAGVAVGTMIGCHESGGGGRPTDDLLIENLSTLSVPVCIGLPFGHGAANRLLPIGTPLCLDGDLGTLSFSQPLVSPPAESVGVS